MTIFWDFDDMPQRLVDGEYMVVLKEEDYKYALACVRACHGVKVHELEPMQLLNLKTGLQIVKEGLEP